MPIPAKSHGCTWHWLSLQDLPEIIGLVDAEEHFGDTTHHHDLAGLRSALLDERVRSSQTGVVLRKPSGTLIQWQVERGIEWFLETFPDADELSRLELSILASSSTHFLAESLPGHGFRAQRWYHALHRPLGHHLPDNELEGVAFEQFGPGWSDAVRELYNRTVAHPSDLLDAQSWQWGLTSAGIRDDLSWVALHEGRVVGWVLNAVADLAGDKAGWTEYLGAGNEWRNRGLYTSLLARSHHSFRDAGLQMAGIGVETDSDQGARPYLALGYQPIDTMVWYVNHPSLDTIGAAKLTSEQDGT